MLNRDDVKGMFDGSGFDAKEIDLALRQLIQRGLVELHFDGDEFCFSVTKDGKEFYTQIIDEKEDL